VSPIVLSSKWSHRTSSNSSRVTVAAGGAGQFVIIAKLGAATDALPLALDRLYNLLVGHARGSLVAARAAASGYIAAHAHQISYLSPAP